MELSKYLNVNYAATFQPQTHFPRLYHDRPGVQRTDIFSILLLHPGVLNRGIRCCAHCILASSQSRYYVCCLGADHESGCMCLSRCSSWESVHILSRCRPWEWLCLLSRCRPSRLYTVTTNTVIFMGCTVTKHTLTLMVCTVTNIYCRVQKKQ